VRDAFQEDSEGEASRKVSYPFWPRVHRKTGALVLRDRRDIQKEAKEKAVATFVLCFLFGYAVAALLSRCHLQ
jgi:hypothetical protein